MFFPLITESLRGSCSSKGGVLCPFTQRAACLFCLIETPGGGRGGEQHQQSTHHCIRGASLSEKGGCDSGNTGGHLLLLQSAQLSLPQRSLLEQLLEGTGWNICGLDGNAYASWNPLKSFQGLVGENRAFHQMQSRSPPPPLLESGSWCWERLVSSGVSLGLALCLPSSHPSLTEKACELSRRENLFRILTFSRVLRPLEAQF